MEPIEIPKPPANSNAPLDALLAIPNAPSENPNEPPGNFISRILKI
jgi:hypothetical protein